MFLDTFRYSSYIIPKDLLFSRKELGEEEKAWDFKYEVLFQCTQTQAALRLPFQRETLISSYFQRLRLVPALQKAIFSAALMLSAVGYCCHMKEKKFLGNFLNRDFIFQTLLRDKLPAMENHSRSAIICTYSQKPSVATALVKREGNRGNEREGIWACMHQHAEQNKDVAGWHKIHVHTYPQRGPQWAKDEEN